MRRDLARFYESGEAIRRVCHDALGAVIEHDIDWQGGADAVWDRVLRACEKRTGALELVVARVRAEYGDALPDGIPRRVTPVVGGAATAGAGLVVSVVGVVAELGATLDAIAERVRGLPGVAVAVVDAAGAEAGGEGLVIAVLGARTGGTGALAAAVGRAAVVLLWREARLERAPIEEAVAALGLRRREGAVEFSAPGEAARAALEVAHGWWQAQQGPGRRVEDDPDPPVLRAWERAWLEARVERWRVGRHGPLAAKGRGVRIERAAIYVALHAERGDAWLDEGGALVLPRLGEPGQRQRKPGRGGVAPEGMDVIEGMSGRDDKTSPAPLERVLSAPERPHLVIEGAPGAGKTVLLQHVAYTLAALHLGELPPAHEMALAGLAGGRLAQPVPLLVEAVALAGCDGLGDIGERLAGVIERAIGADVPRAELRAGLAAGRYLVLCDALDEVGGQGARDALAEALAGWAKRSDSRARFVLTTRPSAWRGATPFPAPLWVVRAAPMSRGEADALVARWCAAQALPDEWAAGADAALTEVSARHGGMEPRANPLLLVCALLVYGEHGALPESPARLYDRIVEILCELRGEKLGEVRQKTLAALFAALQRAGGARVAVPVEVAAHALHAALGERYATVDAARDALDRLYEETGLLQFEDDGGGRWAVRPWHRSFQEYFAARAIADCGDAIEDTTEALIDEGRASDPEWEGVLRFVAGLHAQRGDCARRHVETLHRRAAGHARRGRLLGLAATALREYREAFPGHALYASLPDELVAVYEAEGGRWPVADRLLVLEALGGLGDPRLARPMFVPVEGGEFTMGGDREAWSAAPAHRVRVARLWVGWRPVVVDDFAAFVREGWGEARWWGAGRGEQHGAAPDDWAVQVHHPNRPVVEVSWYAAQAFCRWATESGFAVTRWGAPAEGVVTLPTEAEWEFIARGAEGRVYPWGDAAPGNGDAAQAAYSPGRRGQGTMVLEAATPVGAFPAGSVGAVVDLAGNIWEWCLDGWREPYDPSWAKDDGRGWQVDDVDIVGGRVDKDGGRVDKVGGGVDKDGRRVDTSAAERVARGGSWVERSWNLRAASRFGFHASLRYSGLGFRVVCRVPREHG